MAQNELPEDFRARMGFHKITMGAATAYSVAAIFELATSGPKFYGLEEPLELKIAAVFFVISFTFAVSQLILFFRIESKGRQNKYIEAFDKSGYFTIPFIASLISAFLGTCVLLIQYALWLLAPLVILGLFLVRFLKWQEAQMLPDHQIRLAQDSPTVQENKD